MKACTCCSSSFLLPVGAGLVFRQGCRPTPLPLHLETVSLCPRCVHLLPPFPLPAPPPSPFDAAFHTCLSLGIESWVWPAGSSAASTSRLRYVRMSVCVGRWCGGFATASAHLEQDHNHPPCLPPPPFPLHETYILSCDCMPCGSWCGCVCSCVCPEHMALVVCVFKCHGGLAQVCGCRVWSECSTVLSMFVHLV
jgi:hypothetical protein